MITKIADDIEVDFELNKALKLKFQSDEITREFANKYVYYNSRFELHGKTFYVWTPISLNGMLRLVRELNHKYLAVNLTNYNKKNWNKEIEKARDNLPEPFTVVPYTLKSIPMTQKQKIVPRFIKSLSRLNNTQLDEINKILQ